MIFASKHVIEFKKNEEVYKLKLQEKSAHAEISVGESAQRNLRAKLSQIDQESLKQQAMLYAQEYQIQQLERKVRRAQGERSDEEKEILQKKIDDLTLKSGEQNQRHKLLTVELKKAQDDLRYVSFNK